MGNKGTTFLKTFSIKIHYLMKLISATLVKFAHFSCEAQRRKRYEAE